MSHQQLMFLIYDLLMAWLQVKRGSANWLRAQVWLSSLLLLLSEDRKYVAYFENSFIYSLKKYINYPVRYYDFV